MTACGGPSGDRVLDSEGGVIAGWAGDAGFIKKTPFRFLRRCRDRVDGVDQVADELGEALQLTFAGQL